MCKILLETYSANIAMNDDCERLRMKVTTTGLASLIFSLNLGVKKFLLKNVRNLQEEIVDALYNMAKLVDLAWGIEIYYGLYLNGDPTPIVKLPQACEYAQLL